MTVTNIVFDGVDHDDCPTANGFMTSLKCVWEDKGIFKQVEPKEKDLSNNKKEK